MTIVTDTVMIEGLTLSNIIWRKFRRQPTGYVEKVLAINPGLAATVEIAVGTVITFPIEEVAAQTPTKNVTRLWD